jgi:DNA polymerase-3 subunit epsilon
MTERKFSTKCPLVIIDLETTGTEPHSSRIVEIAVVKIFPDGTKESKCRRINPHVQIPAEATKIHGITNEDVKDCPSFKQIAQSLKEYLEGCDIAGFNILYFDLPLLAFEFSRAGISFDVSKCNIIDAYVIFKKQERRNLSAAVKFYLNRNHDEAHSALADAEATYDVIVAQVEHHKDLGQTPEELHKESESNRVSFDPSGWLIMEDGVVKMGTRCKKHNKKTLQEVLHEDRSYLVWMIDKVDSLLPHTRNIISELLKV